MTETPLLVTVVTPVRNAVRTLPATLASVAAQTHPHIEHLVVDGGSTDGTVALLQSCRGVSWTSAPDRGMYDALNQGLERAQGDWLTCLNADDRYVGPGALAAAVEALAAHPEADVVYGDFRYVDDLGRSLETVASPDFEPRRLRRYNFVPPHAAFVRRRVFRDLALRFDPSLRFAGDWEWFLQMAGAGLRFRHVPVLVTEFRRHAGSITATIGWRGKIDEWHRVCRRHHVSLTMLLAHEVALVPLRRRVRRLRGQD